MNCARLIVAVLAGVAALACSDADAQPRAPEKMGGAVTPDADMDVWLRRLVGRYTFEGMVQIVHDGDCDSIEPQICQSIKGKGDCVAVGDGPGVQCILDVTWLDMFQQPGGVSYLDPAMALFGLDPGNSALNYLLVDNKGLPEGGQGYIKGNRATFRTLYVNAPVLLMEMGDKAKGVTNVYRTVRLDARPDATVVHWSMDIELEAAGERVMWTRFEMTLRRVPQDEEAGKSPVR